ncbi:MAG TPA: hypothetical protein VEU29_03735 [Actinomycetota bacterium]|nr:hypothetical protein [Actinomycetota bacterium]
MSTSKGIALIAIPFVVTGCGGGGGAAPAASLDPCSQPLSVAEPEGVPPALDQAHHGYVADVGHRRGYRAVTVVTRETIVELYPHLARDLVENDHEIVAGDNEGFEAEIFFELHDGRAGRYILREGPCKGDVTVNILYEETKT